MIGLSTGLAMVASLMAVRLAMAWFWSAPHSTTAWH